DQFVRLLRGRLSNLRDARCGVARLPRGASEPATQARAGSEQQNGGGIELGNESSAAQQAGDSQTRIKLAGVGRAVVVRQGGESTTFAERRKVFENCVGGELAAFEGHQHPAAGE